MAFFSTTNTRIAGISAAVPVNKVSNQSLPGSSVAEIDKLIATVGIHTRRIASIEQCATDLCIAAAERLIAELAWGREDIDVVFFVTQTPDYVLPGNSLLVQHRMGLSNSCITFDINQGCAGYVYGLSLITSFMSASKLKRGLLLVGDTITKLISLKDKSLVPLFSDAGTATALEYDEKANRMVFNTSSEGNAHNAIIVPEGGFRNPFNEKSLSYASYENQIERRGMDLAMKGLEVFNFSLRSVVPNVELLLRQAGVSKEKIDYFVFHQANRLILESLSKKLEIHESKVPSSLQDFGNTSCATVPLTIVSSLSKNKRVTDSTMLLSGFGVGLSLASAIVSFSNVYCPELIEVP